MAEFPRGADLASMGPLASALRVARTEFVASLRDRMTLVYTVLLPLAMYPVLFWVMIQGYLILEGKDQRTEVRVAVVASPESVDVERLAQALHVPSDTEDASTAGAPVAVAAFRSLPVEREFAVDEDRGWDAVLWFHDGEATELLYDASRSRSTLARRRVTDRLAAHSDLLRVEALDSAGTTLEAFDPFVVETVDLADEEDVAGLLFSLILPMLFVIMTVLGGFYPAVDTTAGEKERKTAETTALLPVRPGVVVIGKILAVAAAAALATTLNVSGMALAAEHLLSSLGGGGDLSIDPPWAAMLRMTPFAVVFLVFTSCVLVAASSLTRTFKQGQSMLGVVQMAFLFPAIVGTLPVFDLSVSNAWVPVMQTSLVFKALLQGDSAPITANVSAFSIVLVSGLVYAALATWFTIALRSREDLLDEAFNPKHLFSFRKRAKRREA